MTNTSAYRVILLQTVLRCILSNCWMLALPIALCLECEKLFMLQVIGLFDAFTPDENAENAEM